MSFCEAGNSEFKTEKTSEEEIQTGELEIFLKEINDQEHPIQKIEKGIERMSETLSQSGSPQFRLFWEIRQHCLSLFKEQMNPSIRSNLWLRFHDLTEEARRLKQILDEQTSFAIEQIDIAISDLENELNHLDEVFKKSPNPILSKSFTINANINFYQTIQRKLNFLNTQASRVNSLRKELINTDMRMRYKNKFFHRLSKAGDQIFPQRKELIKEMSEQFMKDVETFVMQHFSQGAINEPYFILREEIKELQNVAKKITINSQAFSLTRQRLSECWDKVKDLEKEKKKEKNQKAELYKQIRKEAEERKQKLSEREEQKRKLFHELQQKIESLYQFSNEDGIEQVILKINQISSEIELAPLLKTEKNVLEDQLKKTSHILEDKEEKILNSLPQDKGQALEVLKRLYTIKQERRHDLKDQYECYRKAALTSGLDFQQAIQYNLMLTEAKERLDKVVRGIELVEEKLLEFDHR